MVLRNRVTVRMSCKYKKALKSAAKNAKEKSLSDYIRTTIFNSIRDGYETKTKRLQSNQK